MPRPRVALGAGRLHVDPGGEAGRIHLFRRGCEEDVDARLCGDLLVARRHARVSGEVRLLVELRRVDEERRDHDVVLGTGTLEERNVARVQSPHRRHQADLAFEPKLGDGARDLHVASSAVEAAMAARCASTVDQSPRSIGPVSSNPFSIVRRMSGSSASVGAPALSKRSDAARWSVTR